MEGRKWTYEEDSHNGECHHCVALSCGHLARDSGAGGLDYICFLLLHVKKMIILPKSVSFPFLELESVYSHFPLLFCIH